MVTLLVTGGTGLLGSRVALDAVARGWSVRALVRNLDVEPLISAGVDVRLGDVTDVESLDAAMEGVTYVVHTAALLGGTWVKAGADDMWTVNHDGALNVYAAAERAGVQRCAHVDTQSMWDTTPTITERTALLPITDVDSGYIRSKRAGFVGALHRVMSGQDIVFATPGYVYGPSVFPERALDPTSFTRVVLRAILGEIPSYIEFPMMWTYVADLSELILRALERGTIGSRYLALGRVEETLSMAGFCNLAAELAGSPHRTLTFDVDDPAAPDVGGMIVYARRQYSTPLFDDSRTVGELGIGPVSLEEGLTATVEWLRSLGKIPSFDS